MERISGNGNAAFSKSVVNSLIFVVCSAAKDFCALINCALRLLILANSDSEGAPKYEEMVE